MTAIDTATLPLCDYWELSAAIMAQDEPMPIYEQLVSERAA